MNFDGKAFVKNTMAKTFISVNDRAFVIGPVNVNDFSPVIKSRDKALSLPIHMANSKTLNITNKTYSIGLVPYTVQVCNKEIRQSFRPQKFIISRDATTHNKVNDVSYELKKVYVSRLQPTNIKYNPKSTIVYDSEVKETQTVFTGTSVNIISKIQVVIPENSSGYTDMSLVVQKNSFIEIKLLDNVTDVMNLPDALEFLPGYIKGTFTQSGEYNIKIKYPDGEQVLNIVVPYYQRLL